MNIVRTWLLYQLSDNKRATKTKVLADFKARTGISIPLSRLNAIENMDKTKSGFRLPKDMREFFLQDCFARVLDEYGVDTSHLTNAQMKTLIRKIT